MAMLYYDDTPYRHLLIPIRQRGTWIIGPFGHHISHHSSLHLMELHASLIIILALNAYNHIMMMMVMAR